MFIRLDDKGIQKPIYYTNQILYNVETNYFKPKIIFVLIISTRHLKPYFQVHLIVVLTDQPLRVILQWLDISRRMAKWAIKLNEFDIFYQPQMMMKP